MDRQTELFLLRELVDLSARGSAFLDETVTPSPVERYASAARFRQERDGLFRRWPVILAHSGELAEANTFKTSDICGLPILLARGADGLARAFINVCRHRGSRLESAACGRKKAFSCPYHGWTYENDGRLRAIPQKALGFPDLDREQYGLRALPTLERDGWIWVLPNPAIQSMEEGPLQPLADLIGWLRLEDHQVVATTEIDCAANWKLLIEGGIEAYHFKIAHKDTIGPHFMNNLSSYQTFGRHMRSVLARESLRRMAEEPEERWDIRMHTNILYTLFPASQLLVMQDHIAWVSFSPINEGRTTVRLSTLAPKEMIGEEFTEHWQRNHAITTTTLGEDFAIGEGIQAGFASGANDALTFGRFEGALNCFNQWVEAAIAEP